MRKETEEEIIRFSVCNGPDSMISFISFRNLEAGQTYIQTRKSSELYVQFVSIFRSHIFCYSGLTFNLAYGNNLMHGQVRFTIDNQTGSFCGTFNDSVAMVVCRQMGFVSGKSLLPLLTSTGSGNYQFTNVACIGNENSFTHCSFKIIEKDFKIQTEGSCGSCSPTDASCLRSCYMGLRYNRMNMDPCYIREQPLTVQCYTTGAASVVILIRIITCYTCISFCIICSSDISWLSINYIFA